MLTEILARKRLPQLDGLRFIACAMVIVYHGGFPMPAGDGVMYFFVLSGFLFAWLFTAQWERRPDSISLRDYYWKRSCRILPAAYGAILFTLLARRVLKIHFDVPHALSAAFYYANYYNALNGHPGASGLAHYWSLAVEEQFYFVWPLCFIFFMRRGRGSTNQLVAFLVVAVVVVCAWRSYAHLVLGLSAAYTYNAFDCRFDSLAIGCLAGALVRRASVARFVEKLSGHPVAPAVTLAAIGGLLRLGSWFEHSIGFTIISVLIALLMMQLMVQYRSPWWSWLDSRPMRYLGGTLSYSMYLYHEWGLGAGHKLGGGILMLLVGFPASIGLAAASHYIVEKPFLWIRDWRTDHVWTRRAASSEGKATAA